MKRWYRFRGLLLLVVAEMKRTDTHTHEPSTVTLAAHARQGLDRNPRCACAPRVIISLQTVGKSVEYVMQEVDLCLSLGRYAWSE